MRRVVRTEIGVLGPLQLATVGGPAIDLASSKQRAVLAMLALDANRVIGLDVLLLGLWGLDPPDSAVSTMRSHLSRLRKALSPDPTVALSARRPGYVLQIDAERVDACRFERLVAQGRAKAARDPLAAVAAYEAALALWRGPALADLTDLEFARLAADRLEAARLDAADGLAAACLDAGRPERAAAVLSPVLEANPFRERTAELLMLALYRSGRQADALHAYRQVRRDLTRELGLEPTPALRELERRILLHDPAVTAGPAVAAPAAAAHHLPAPVRRFVGRRSERRRIAQLLGTTRLLTLVGAGGVGKTRLAAAAAAVEAHAFPDGVYFVDLAPLTEPQLLPAVLAAALELAAGPEHASASGLLAHVVAHLADRRTLLVLDNCEHLLGPASAATAELLATCPGVVVLATSRQRLGTPGETTWRVPSLSLPPPGASKPDELAGSDAVELLCDRASASAPGFRLHAGNAAAVARLCHRLDGIPLALELAAANLDVMDLADMAAALDARLPAAAADAGDATRHATLRACLDWGHDLLGPAERRLLHRLSVFAGTFDLEAVEVVGGGRGTEVLEALSRLTDASWVAVEAGRDGMRLRLAETVRRYAAEHLALAGEDHAAGRAHRDHFLLAVNGYHGPPLCATRLWLARVAADYPNLRAALAWSWADGDVENGLRLAGRLFPYWILDGRVHEGRHWLERTLAAQPAEPGPARTWAQVAHGLLLTYCGEAAAGLDLWRRAREGLDGPDPLAQAYATGALGTLQRGSDPVVGERLLREARAALAALDRRIGTAWCDFNLGWFLLARDERGAATAAFTAALAVGESEGSDVLVVHALSALGSLHALDGDRARALACAADAVATARRLRLRHVLVMALARAAEATVLAAEPERAARLVAEALHLIRELGGHMWLPDMLQVAALILAARGAHATAACLLATGTGGGLHEGGHRPLHHATRECREQLAVVLGPAFQAAWEAGLALGQQDAATQALSALGT